MSELLYVLKCLAITLLLTVFMQVRIGNTSMEAQSQWFLQKSAPAIYVQAVAAGGALALKDFFTSVKSGVSGKISQFRQGSSSQAGK
ncbi:MAG: hypothetical protein EOP06_05985 [Proteobacteria bacterium]|nr:MAG: hypothetical protein EOP06_05985 [Pseudomonadota bacterium]